MGVAVDNGCGGGGAAGRLRLTVFDPPLTASPPEKDPAVELVPEQL